MDRYSGNCINGTGCFWLEILVQVYFGCPKRFPTDRNTGHQFGWEIRYPGRDGVLGRKNYKLTDPAQSNPLGVD